MMQTNIYDVRHAENPSHIRTSFKDEIRNKAVVQTVYSGKILIHHGATIGDWIAFQYPLLGFFRENNGMVTPGVIPIDHERQFLGTTAMAALSSILIKDTDYVSQAWVTNLHADLHFVGLAPTNRQVFAVVLTGVVTAIRSEISAIDYHVTVLTGLSDKSENRFGTPILSNTPDWNGTYTAIGASPVLSGIPSENLP
jgi:hypothetical protein